MSIDELISKYAFHAPCTPEEHAEYSAAFAGTEEAELNAILAYQQQQRVARKKEKLGVVYTAGEKISDWWERLFRKAKTPLETTTAPRVDPDWLKRFAEGKVPPLGSA